MTITTTITMLVVFATDKIKLSILIDVAIK